MNYQIVRLEPFGICVTPASAAKRSLEEIKVEEIREFFLREQIVIFRGFEAFDSTEGFVDYCERWGEISIWPFGKVLDLREQENPQDHIFDNNYVPLHWDGMYRPHVPEYQIFRCLQAPPPGQGGRTTFSNTLRALENAESDFLDVMSSVTGRYQRAMEFYKSVTVSPIIAKHPYRDLKVIRYNEPPDGRCENFLNPPDLNFSGIKGMSEDRFHHELKELLYSKACFYAHEWQEGDLVITDNFSLLHGRESFRTKAPRHLERVQVLSSPPFPNPGLESYQ